MIILDTNVVSEAMKVQPSVKVEAWTKTQDPAAVFITTITQAEIFYGIECLPDSRRREHLRSMSEKVLAQFEGRILSFDKDAARHYSHVVVRRERAGRPISDLDAMIAAIARTHRASVATRDISGFHGCGVDLINPWEP